jgi:hypothetical protein
MSFGALVVPAALMLGAPSAPATLQKGLFCESKQLLQMVVALADRGDDPQRLVRDINGRLNRRACIYATESDVQQVTLRYEGDVTANRSVYSIYQVEVTAFGRQKTEVGHIYWTLPQPLVMYTLREGRTEQLRERDGAK